MTKTSTAVKKTKHQLLFNRTLIFVCLGAILTSATISLYLFSRDNGSVQNLSNSHVAQTLPSALQCAEDLPVNVLVGQVLMVGLPADEMSNQASMFRQYHVGGAVLMSSPANPSDGSIKSFKSASHSIPLLISTDEEGGNVQRFETLGSLPSPQAVANSLSTDQAQQIISEHAARLKSVGVDMVLGPLADVSPTAGDGPLGSRAFSSDPYTVGRYDLAYIKGWQSAGLLPTLKHFPGMGSASANTDYQTATTPPLTSLKQRDFVPYEELTGKGAVVMVGNQNVPGWFDGPASLSPVVDNYLRNKLGYSVNLIITDSLDATAITSQSTLPDAVVDAIAAGNDMALIVGGDPYAITTKSNRSYISQSESELERAVKSGRISKQQLAMSVVRKLAAQKIPACSVTPSDF
jgi:beta-N-acetylhexosaminidase